MDSLPNSISGILERIAYELRCSICLSTFKDPYATPCQHVFCHDCICMALDNNEKCPLCKQKVTRRALTSATETKALLDAYRHLVQAYQRQHEHTISDLLLSQVPSMPFYHTSSQLEDHTMIESDETILEMSSPLNEWSSETSIEVNPEVRSK
jgi:hypothetical protein